MDLPVELFLAMRYLRPRRSFVSIITVLSFLGVTLGVMVLIVVLSVMTGFREEFDAKIIGFNAHITVAPTDGGVLTDPDRALEIIRKVPDVVAAGPVIKGPVLIWRNGRISSAFIKSVPQEGDDPVLPLKKFIKLGEYELRGDSIIVGSEWSRENSAFPGDELDIYGPALLESVRHQSGPNRTIMLPESPIIRGVFKTGKFDYDNNVFLVSTEMAQRLYGLGNAVHGIAVRVQQPFQAETVKTRLNAVLPPSLHARTWMDDNQEFFNALATERVVMTIILFFVMLVAAFGLCSTLITITVQKSREIGLMKALGANDFQVCGVFLFHGIVVGVVGAVCGTAGGLLLLHFRNPFRHFLMTNFHVQVFPGSVYGLPEIPAVIDPTVVTLIALSAIVVCVLAALLPAINAASLAPARALRYE